MELSRIESRFVSGTLRERARRERQVRLNPRTHIRQVARAAAAEGEALRLARLIDLERAERMELADQGEDE